MKYFSKPIHEILVPQNLTCVWEGVQVEVQTMNKFFLAR